MCSEKPAYLSKVNIMHALAPVAFMSHVQSPPIRVIAPFVSALNVGSLYTYIGYTIQMTSNFNMSNIFQTISSWLGIYDISPTDAFIRIAGERMCRDKAITQTICKNLLFLIMGYTSDQLNTVYN